MNIAAEKVRYVVDQRASRFSVRVSAVGLLSAMGHNPTIGVRDLIGEADFVPGSLADASVRCRVRADKLSVLDDISDKDRQEIERVMRGEVLETSRFPEIGFESTHVTATPVGEGRYSLIVSGRLTLHGATRELSIPAQVVQVGDTYRAFGEFSLRQTDYGIKPVSVVGGTLKVKDDLTLTFDIVTRKQE